MAESADATAVVWYVVVHEGQFLVDHHADPDGWIVPTWGALDRAEVLAMPDAKDIAERLPAAGCLKLSEVTEHPEYYPRLPFPTPPAELERLHRETSGPAAEAGTSRAAAVLFRASARELRIMADKLDEWARASDEA